MDLQIILAIYLEHIHELYLYWYIKYRFIFIKTSLLINDIWLKVSLDYSPGALKLHITNFLVLNTQS